jgi:hypothetical protein
VYVLPAQKNHFMAYNYMSIEKVGGDKLERTFYDTNEELHYIDTLTTDFLTSWNFWDGYSRSHLDNDLFMTYGTQTMKYIKNKELWYYKGKYYNYIDLLKFLVKYSKKNFVNKKIQW